MEKIRVFISYRRDDSKQETARLYDDLVKGFGPDQVFKDDNSIPIGVPFPKVLAYEVGRCDVFLAVIGEEWLSITDKNGNRRLDDPKDFVRIEIEMALDRQILVIPVLFDHASLPKPEELPESLRNLAFRNATEILTNWRFHGDVDRLILQIKEGVSALRGDHEPPPPPPPPPGWSDENPWDEPRLLPGRFGNYRIIKPLGMGGTGSAYLVADQTYQNHFVLKLPYFRQKITPEKRERLLEEARSAQALDHPYLTPVLEVGEIEKRLCLIRAYVEGDSLEAWLRSREFTLRQVAVLVGKVAVALQEAHRLNVFHQNLKPTNIILGKVGESLDPTVVDFAQARGDRKGIGTATDIHALGLVMYEMLAGRLPSFGSGQSLTDPLTLPSKHRADRDSGLDAICMKAISNRGQDRYASMTALYTDLKAFVQARPLPSPAPPPPPVKPPETRQPPGGSRTPAQGSSGQKSKSKTKPKKKVDSPGNRRSIGSILGWVVLFCLLLIGGMIAVSVMVGSMANPDRTRGPGTPKSPSTNQTKPTSGAKSQPPINNERLASSSDSVNMQMVRIQPGEFWMGSLDSDKDASDDEKPRHRVKITRAFYLGAFEVTQRQYRTIMGTNPSRFTDSDQRPVERVSWADAAEFCNALSKREGFTPYYSIVGDGDVRNLSIPNRNGNGYRLPTEAEWEYACRAKSATKFCFGDDEANLKQYACYSENSPNKTEKVGKGVPNDWGLYDMHGNVFEWCNDQYEAKYYQTLPTFVSDPTGPPLYPQLRRYSTGNDLKVFRGGNWANEAKFARSACRLKEANILWFNQDIGFRVARTDPNEN